LIADILCVCGCGCGCGCVWSSSCSGGDELSVVVSKKRCCV